MTYHLRNSLAYLLNRAGTRSGELFSRRLTPYGITLPMYRVLVVLGEMNDQRLSDLGAMTSIEISTLSRLTSGMMRRGLVSRERLDGDGRTVTIGLTTAGRELANELIPLAMHHEQISLQDLDPRSVAELKRSLVAIHDNLDAVEDELLPAASAAKPPFRPAVADVRMPPAGLEGDE